LTSLNQLALAGYAETDSAWRSFVFRFGLVVLLALVAIGTLNYLVNPEGLYQTHLVPQILWSARPQKAALLKAARPVPQAVILGSSFNGVNLLNGDSLKLVFDETGKSTSTIAGVTFNPAGLGLAALTAGTDFIDTNATNTVLTALNTASITLRSQASAFGANLSIVQIRQDFNKNIINVLQTGSANLTLADSNEEAANSQALSTRQSIATSALSLANQAQQNVLQLLR